MSSPLTGKVNESHIIQRLTRWLGVRTCSENKKGLKSYNLNVQWLKVQQWGVFVFLRQALSAGPCGMGKASVCLYHPHLCSCSLSACTPQLKHAKCSNWLPGVQMYRLNTYMTLAHCALIIVV